MTFQSTLNVPGPDGLTPNQRTAILQQHAMQDRAYQAGTQPPNKTSFVRRRIDLTFALGEGTFGETGARQVSLYGLRVSATIEKAGGTSMGQAHLRVYGLQSSTMNSLNTLGLSLSAVRKDTVAIKAGDDVSGGSLVFQGTIYQAWSDYEQPNVCLEVQASAGLFEAVRPVPPNSFNGMVDVATIMAGLATEMGLTFENSGVSVMLSYPYFPGTAWDQAQSAARAANINMAVDNSTLAIWPKEGSRGGLIPLVSPATGLVGYPKFNPSGVVFRTLFNPSIGFGQTVELQSSLTPACGKWVVRTLTYLLESETSGGSWFMDVLASRPGETIVR